MTHLLIEEKEIEKAASDIEANTSYIHIPSVVARNLRRIKSTATPVEIVDIDEVYRTWMRSDESAFNEFLQSQGYKLFREAKG